MDWPRLDTNPWNLSLGVLATSMLAACGPFVILEGETDSDSATDTDPPPPDPSETDTTPAQCNSASDCEPGYECIGNVCMPYGYYCDDGGCCYGGTGGCCYYGGCYYSDCFSDAECGFQEICIQGYSYGYGECVYIAPIPECPDAPDIVALELPDIEGGFVGLSFVDANGDAAQDLVLGGQGRAQLHLGPGEVPPIELPLSADVDVVTEAVSGDFTGDGNQDLVLLDATGRLLVLAGDGATGFSLVNEQYATGWLGNLVALRWNGDDALDLVGTDQFGNALLLLNDSGTFESIEVLPTGTPVTSLVRTDFDGNGNDDLLTQDPYAGTLFLAGNLDPDGYLPGTVHGERTLVSGPLAQGTPHEVIGHTPMSGDWRLLELWNDGQYGPIHYSLFDSETFAIEMGDWNGDAIHDLALGSSDRITYVRAWASDTNVTGLDCQLSYLVGGSIDAMAMGDFDGNGRADVAYGGLGGLGGPTVLLTY